MNATQRDRRIRQLEIELVDATDQRYWDLSAELSELVAEVNAEQEVVGNVADDLQDPSTMTRDQIWRQSMQRAREVRAKITKKQSQGMHSEAGGTWRTDVTDTDPDGLPL